MLLEQVEPAKGHGGARRQADNIRLKHGDSQQYLISRLKRDNPQLAESVIRGELTAHAAAIAAWRGWTANACADFPVGVGIGGEGGPG